VKNQGITNDPYLLKLMELIFKNLKSRFQIFGNAFCFLDFKNRGAISFDDFSRGLDGLSIKISKFDQRAVFAYLIGVDED
jgi:hypothetical protein